MGVFRICYVRLGGPAEIPHCPIARYLSQNPCGTKFGLSAEFFSDRVLVKAKSPPKTILKRHFEASKVAFTKTSIAKARVLQSCFCGASQIAAAITIKNNKLRGQTVRLHGARTEDVKTEHAQTDQAHFRRTQHRPTESSLPLG